MQGAMGTRSRFTGAHIVMITAIIAVTVVTLTLLLVPSTRAAIVSLIQNSILIIGLPCTIVFMVKGGSLGSQVFALSVITLLALLFYASINTPHPELYLGVAWNMWSYLAVMGLLIVFCTSWCRSRQRVYIPHSSQVQSGQLRIGHTQ